MGQSFVVNSVHEQVEFLNKIEAYPIQFAQIESYGILFATKYSKVCFVCFVLSFFVACTFEILHK